MAAGGFDVVLGNPPWERVKLQEQEFFAARDTEITEAPTAAARGRLIAKLKDAEPGTRERALYEAFETAKRISEASSVFARAPKEDCGRFPLTGRGDVNTYALFAELFAGLAGPRGRAGVIVPTGIALDDTTRYFFKNLVDAYKLISLFSFYEIRGWFKATDDRKSFCLLTLGKGTGRPSFVFDIKSLNEMLLAERRFTLSPDDIALINPNTRTAPVFRARADAELTAKIYSRVPVLIDEGKGTAGNPWSVSFHTRIWHMAEDSAWFHTAAELAGAGFISDGRDWVLPEGVRPHESARNVERSDGWKLPLTGRTGGQGPQRWVPLYEAKMIHQFDHRWATYEGADCRDATIAEKQDPDFEPTPRYWIPDFEVAGRLTAKGWTRDWLMGWRDITNAHVLRTVIAATIPAVGSGDKFLLMFPNSSPKLCAALYGSMNSLVCDFVARQKLGGNSLKLFLIRQFPVLPPSAYTIPDLSFIVPRVVELTYTSRSMAPFARDLGYDGPPFAWVEERRAQLRGELDAWYGRAYGLTRDELRYILDPADVRGPDYPSETFRVLKKNEIARYGEYRTARLVLAAWDAQEARLAAAQ
jgi:hypothetical protein